MKAVIIILSVVVVGLVAGTAWYYKDTKLALIGFVAFLGCACVAVVLNTIDEQTNR